MMAEAFDLAEKYRHPVLIASDAAIGQMIEAVEIPKFIEHDINKYDWTIKGCKKAMSRERSRMFTIHIQIMKLTFPINMQRWNRENRDTNAFRLRMQLFW